MQGRLFSQDKVTDGDEYRGRDQRHDDKNRENGVIRLFEEICADSARVNLSFGVLVRDEHHAVFVRFAVHFQRFFVFESQPVQSDDAVFFQLAVNKFGAVDRAFACFYKICCGHEPVQHLFAARYAHDAVGVGVQYAALGKKFAQHVYMLSSFQPLSDAERLQIVSAARLQYGETVQPHAVGEGRVVTLFGIVLGAQQVEVALFQQQPQFVAARGRNALCRIVIEEGKHAVFCLCKHDARARFLHALRLSAGQDGRFLGQGVQIQLHRHAARVCADKDVLRAVLIGQVFVDLAVRIRRREVVQRFDVRIRRHRRKGVREDVHFVLFESERKGDGMRAFGVVHEGKGRGKVVCAHGAFLDVIAHERIADEGVQIAPVIGEDPLCTAQLRHDGQCGRGRKEGRGVVFVDGAFCCHHVQIAVQVGGEVVGRDAHVARFRTGIGGVLQGIGVRLSVACGEEKLPVRIGDAHDARDIVAARGDVAVFRADIKGEDARTVHGKRVLSRAHAGRRIVEGKGRIDAVLNTEDAVLRSVRKKECLAEDRDVRSVFGKPVHAVAVARDLVACILFRLRGEGAEAAAADEIDLFGVADLAELAFLHGRNAHVGAAALFIEIPFGGEVIASLFGKRKGRDVVRGARVLRTVVLVGEEDVFVPGKIDLAAVFRKGRGEVARLAARGDVSVSRGGKDVARAHCRVKDAVLRVGKVYVRAVNEKGRARFDLRFHRLRRRLAADPEDGVAPAHVRGKVQKRLSVLRVKIEGGDAVRILLGVGGVALFRLVVQPDLVSVRNGDVFFVFRNIRGILQVEVLFVRFGQEKLCADAFLSRRSRKFRKAENARTERRRGKYRQ